LFDVNVESQFPSDEEIRSWVIEHNPELIALKHEIESAKLGRSLAAKEYYPDFAIGVQTISTGSARAAGTRGSGTDPWLLSFSLEIPLWHSKYRAAEREANAATLAAREKFVDRLERLYAEVERSLYELRDAKRRIELYGGSLARKAEEARGSTVASFQVDQSDFRDVVEAERMVLDLELEKAKAIADRIRAEAKLDRQLGRLVLQEPEVGTRT
ncbi:MAG: TolC family protein, partial [Planctomycetota bacterium]